MPTQQNRFIYLLGDLRIRVLICVLLGGMGQGIVAPKMPELLQGSKALAWDSGVSATLMYLGIFLSTFQYGKMADRGKVHYLLGPGLLVYSAVLLGLGMTRNPAAFMGLRFLEGLALSAVYVGADFVLGRLSPASTRGQWLSFYGVALSLGLLVGPLLTLLIPPAALGVAASFAILLALFIWNKQVPKSDEEPGAPPRWNWSALLSGAVYGYMESGLVAILPILTVTEFRIRPELALIVVILSAALSSVVWGHLSDRFEPKPVVFALLALLATGPASLALLHATTISPAFIAYGSFILFGLIAGGLYPVGFAWLLRDLSESRFGQASGAFARAYGVGSLLGPLACGLAGQRWGSSGLFLSLSTLGLGAVFATLTLERGRPPSLPSQKKAKSVPRNLSPPPL